VRRAFVFAAAILALASCGGRERPEGAVERWLLALNQGSAGEPLRYADVDVTQAVLREWRSAEPGTFEVIEVGKGVPCQRGPIGCETMVPFRLELVEGGQLRLDAFVVTRPSTDGERRLVGAVTTHDEALRLPSEGGEPIGAADAPAWIAALGVGLGLTAISIVALRLAGARAQRD